ncbi:MAG TPA: helix-turn-helix transcriptional regulator [Solirubrobacteraceae bacterium]|jgi:transcriptional regulator with XRE-family HTH domain|nr:helix-turn-helix transcriptional regulator [Solirubrobacteraceae bacterium]
MPSTREQFAENLKRQRDRAGLSQEALADVCDLHRTEISLLERSKRSPRLETIVILAKGLGLSSAGELLDGIS